MNQQQTTRGDGETVKPLTAATIDRLRIVNVFASLNESTLHCLDGATEIHLNHGETLVQQGETVRSFWILLSGELRAAGLGPDGNLSISYTMQSGITFGEVPLLASVPSAVTIQADKKCDLLQLKEEQFWLLMTRCPDVRKAILGNMAMRLVKMQSVTFHQEKMASLGSLAAGLMHELNNPGAAARRASTQLRENLLRMHSLSKKFALTELRTDQKRCIFQLQEHALTAHFPDPLNSLEQSDAEEALAQWMESASIEHAWKLAPTLASIGMHAEDLDCARRAFNGPAFSDALNWLEALVSSMQLVGTIEESIGRVTELVHAVKSYAYESRGQKQTLEINSSIQATLVILGHKIREKQLVLTKDFSPNLPSLQTEAQGLNQIWTNLLDNAIDAAPQAGHISIRTWAEVVNGYSQAPRTDLCIMITDNGQGISTDCQAHIFDPFFTTKPVGVGTGLGLGIVYKIVEQYGGTIRFASTPGDTEFVVRLPAART